MQETYNAQMTKNFSQVDFTISWWSATLYKCKKQMKGVKKIRTAISFAYAVYLWMIPRKIYWIITYMSWRKLKTRKILEFWSWRTRNKFGMFCWNVLYGHASFWVQIQSMLLQKISWLSPVEMSCSTLCL